MCIPNLVLFTAIVSVRGISGLLVAFLIDSLAFKLGTMAALRESRKAK